MEANKVAEWLERVANGDTEAADVLKLWPEVDTGDHLLAAAWHDLSHFAADADIREKDIQYDEYQRTLLRSRASAIRGRARNVKSPLPGS